MKPLMREEVQMNPTTVRVMEELRDGEILFSTYGGLYIFCNQGSEGFSLTGFKNGNFANYLKNAKEPFFNSLNILTREEALTALAKMWGLEEVFNDATAETITALRKQVEELQAEKAEADRYNAEVIVNFSKKVQELQDRERLANETIAFAIKSGEHLKKLNVEETTKAMTHLSTPPAPPEPPTDGNFTLAQGWTKTPPEPVIPISTKEKHILACLNDENTTTAPPAPAIRRFKLVNAKWLEEWQKSGQATEGQKQLDCSKEYQFECRHFNSSCTFRDFMALVDRGIYVEMTPGRVVYQKGEEFWTTDAAGDTRWLCIQHLCGKGPLSAVGVREIINRGFAKIIG